MWEQDLQMLLDLHHRLFPSLPKGLRSHAVYCVAKTGQKIRFTEPQDIPNQLSSILKNSLQLMSEKNWAMAFSLLWLGLIAVHPFADGNGRVALAYLQLKMEQHSLEIENLERLKCLLLTNDAQQNLEALGRFFTNNLKFKGSV